MPTAVNKGRVGAAIGTPVTRNNGHLADDTLELGQAFDDAELRGDADQLDALLADDFLFTAMQVRGGAGRGLGLHSASSTGTR